MQFKNCERNQAYQWVLKNIPKSASIEKTDYSINVPDGYENFKKLPGYFRRESFESMTKNNLYLKMKSMLNFLDFKDDSSTFRIESEPYEVSLEALFIRKPTYLILSDIWYNRYFIEKMKPEELNPLQHELFNSILNNQTPYKKVAEFDNKPSWFLPELEFVNGKITIYKLSE